MIEFIKKIATGLIIGVALIGAGGAFYFYQQYQASQHQIQALKKGSGGGTQGEDNAALIAKLGRLIVLPTDEQPTIATVTDLAKLAGQPFFAQAKLGDKVFIYSNAKKAILYDEAANKIVEVAPINIGASPTPQP